MKLTLTSRFGRWVGLGKILLFALLVGSVVYGCNGDKIEAPDLDAGVAFIGDTLQLANPTQEDWKDINILIDDVYAYHVDELPAQDVVFIGLENFETVDDVSYPAEVRKPQSVLVETNMGRYWGEFNE